MRIILSERLFTVHLYSTTALVTFNFRVCTKHKWWSYWVLIIFHQLLQNLTEILLTMTSP